MPVFFSSALSSASVRFATGIPQARGWGFTPSRERDERGAFAGGGAKSLAVDDPRVMLVGGAAPVCPATIPTTAACGWPVIPTTRDPGVPEGGGGGGGPPPDSIPLSLAASIWNTNTKACAGARRVQREQGVGHVHAPNFLR
jgi:hypothetical protein